MFDFLKRNQQKKSVNRSISVEEFNRLESKHTVVNDYYQKYGLPL
ncbi:hypothetical protein [Bacillus solimangrovi]|nr:hypothetical protein [Bacillus solimangrovi]